MKTSGILLFVLIVGGVAAYFQFKSGSHACPPVNSANVNRVQNNKLMALTEDKKRLEEKIKALEDENQRLLTKIHAYQQNSSASLEISSVTSLRDPGQDIAEEIRMQQLAEQHALELTDYLKSLNSNSEKDFNSKLTEKFDAEPVDYTWADDQEAKLGQLFVARKNLSKFVPEGIICKTSRCQIKIPISSIKESNEVMEELSQALAESPGLEESVILTLPDINSGFVDFYIARDKDVKLYR